MQVESLLELVGPALLLGPCIRVGAGVLLKDSKVGAGLDYRASARRPQDGSGLGSALRRDGLATHQLLLAENADRGCLWLLLGGSIGVDGNASAGGLGLLVLAVNAVLLGDRHLECMCCNVLEDLCVCAV